LSPRLNLLMRILPALLLLLVLCLFAAGARAASTGLPGHALATFGEPLYPAGFHHFNYVNPDAPKGGTLYLGNPDRRTTFDKFNPFTLKGNAPAGMSLFMFETMAILGGDEPSSMYGLLADQMSIAPDNTAITFRLNDLARFSNGDAVTTEDVRHTFELLRSKKAAPAYQTLLAEVKAVVVVDARTIRFELAQPNRDLLFNLGIGLPVVSRKWGLGPDGKQKPLDEIITDYPIASGPYTIAKAESGRRLELVRNRDYWARDLNVRRGFFNFDRVIYRYYQDRAISLEAFKAGEFDILVEYSARRWMRQHEGPKYRDGRIIKGDFVNGTGAGLQAYYLNQRRPIFQDARVREALNWSYDFEWSNRQAYNQYQRAYSVFSNSDFAARGLPADGELKLLEGQRAHLDASVFGPAWVNPRTDSEPDGLRRNLLRARDLLAAAGWTIAADGVLRNARGEPFEIEYLSADAGSERSLAPWQRNLDKLGIKMKLRAVDFAIYRKRLEQFDYDLTTIRSTDFTLPSGTDLLDAYGSKNADVPGSNNLLGLKNPALDAVIERIVAARTMEELRDGARAFDRIFMRGHYVIPDLYSGKHRASYWNKFGRPAQLPKYYTIESTLDAMPAWAVTTWWMKDR
jgi:microcin C transport system substrate-binding protein